jgi:two-component system response regulator VicR
MKLLLVEDDKTIVLGLEYSLSQEGFNVISCYDSKTALNLIESEKFDFALLDINLPDGNGFDICRRLKEKDDTPVIFNTQIFSKISHCRISIIIYS